MGEAAVGMSENCTGCGRGPLLWADGVLICPRPFCAGHKPQERPSLLGWNFAVTLAPRCEKNDGFRSVAAESRRMSGELRRLVEQRIAEVDDPEPQSGVLRRAA